MAAFQTVQTTRIYEEIVNQIKEAIGNGRFAPGDQLPGERDLAEMFGVGRTSVREALRALEAEGLVFIRQGQGTFITQKEYSGFAEHFADLLMQNECTPLQILEARIGVELHMARLAAEKRSDTHLRQLAECLAEMEALIGQGESPTRPDQCFHLAIAEAAQNIILRNLFENILELMQGPVWMNAKNAVLEDTKITKKYLQQHEAIFTAIRDQAAEEAAARMHEHLMAIYLDQLALDEMFESR
jgi:GntR family transcriptional repressor for pyruvate dehydrogenase complex